VASVLADIVDAHRLGHGLAFGTARENRRMLIISDTPIIRRLVLLEILWE
jgi:hypothetical protein